jgi:hypothetical protein
MRIEYNFGCFFKSRVIGIDSTEIIWGLGAFTAYHNKTNEDYTDGLESYQMSLVFFL